MNTRHRCVMTFCMMEALVAGPALAESKAEAASCRQSWAPKDAPAFCGWRQERALPEPRTYHSTLVSDSGIYVFGGYWYDSAAGKAVFHDSVLRSKVLEDGTLTPWSPEPSFTTGRSGAAVAQVGSCVFLNGGTWGSASEAVYGADTQVARLLPGGRLSPWASGETLLRTPRSNHSLVPVTTASGSFLYAIAGVTQRGRDTVHLDTIEFASVSSDCKVGEWTEANFHLHGGRSSPQALRVGQSLVILGGWGDLDLVDVYRDVQVTTPRADGSLAPWQRQAAPMPSGVYGHSTLVVPTVDPRALVLLSVGGQPSTGVYGDWISYAYVRAEASLPGGVGAWRIAPSGYLPGGRAGHGLVHVGGRLYVIGGSGRGEFHRDVISSLVEPGTPE